MAYVKQNYLPGDVLTAEQVNKMQDAIINNEGNIGSHIDDKNNPHGLTATQIGAAPAGYGLGENAAACPNSDCNQAVNSGWYTVSGSNTANGPGENGVMLVLRRNSSCIWQYHFSYSANPSVRRRMCISDAWYAWEWVNPPMELGKEYRTTERWQGKVVYAQLFNCGALPNNSTKNTTLTFDKKTIVDMTAVAIGAGSTYKLPALNEDASDNKIAFWNMGASVFVKTFGSGWDNFTLYVTVKYTKD